MSPRIRPRPVGRRNEIATAIADVAQGAEQQVQMIETVRGAVDEVRAVGQSSVEQAELTAQVADQAREVAREGVSAADRRHER
jgi:methyl-accepting chemotaxis protein